MLGDHMESKSIRLNKYLSDAGVCSRREADRLIEEGKVYIDGEPAVMGQKVIKGQKVICGGKPVEKEEEFILLAVNKPAGIVCTTAKTDKDNIVDFVGYSKRIYPIGRLDKESEGLILMTNQGDIVNKLLRGGNGHEKEYLVKINRPVTEEFLRAMKNGIPILNTMTKKCFVEKAGNQEFRIILTQGLNRQIRRMCEYLGCKVVKLKRVRIMNIRLGNLKTGSNRRVEGKELREFLAIISGSTNLSYKEYRSGK